MDAFWNRFATHRVSRRRALAAGGGLSAATLFLAACGGGGSDVVTPESKDKSGLLGTPEDTTRQAVRGGVWTTDLEEAINVDPIAQNTSTGFNFTVPVYSKLAKYGLSNKPNVLPTTKDITGDAAESWEIAPD